MITHQHTHSKLSSRFSDTNLVLVGNNFVVGSFHMGLQLVMKQAWQLLEQKETSNFQRPTIVIFNY